MHTHCCKYLCRLQPIVKIKQKNNNNKLNKCIEINEMI